MAKGHFTIEESIKLKVAQQAGKECTIVAEQNSVQLLKRIIEEKKHDLQSKIALGSVDISKFKKNPYLIRAMQRHGQFQALSGVLSEADENLVAMDENFDKIRERMKQVETNVQELVREVEKIGDVQRIEALAEQYTRKFTMMSNKYNNLLQAAESSEAKRDKAKGRVQSLQSKMVRISEGVEGIPSVKAVADIQFDKLSEAIKVKKGRLVAIATEKEVLEDNMRIKKDDIDKEHVSANSLNKHIESTNSILDRTTAKLAKKMALNSELKERIRIKLQTSEPAKASKRKSGATTESEPAKRRRGRK